jgi:hypothetical protein
MNSEFTQETIGMTTQTAEKKVKLDKKSGKGLRDGAISEGAFFFDVKPGHEQELRAAVERWADFLRKSPVEETLKTGLRDSRHIIFDGGKRLVWMTTFENDWDPYVEDALVVVGLGNFIDWIQHTKQIDAFEVWMREAGGREVLMGAKGVYRVDAAREKAVRASAAGLKALLQAAQTPAAGYFNAVSYLTHPQIIKSWQVNQAFQQILDDPAANEALRNPTLKPLLEQAVD